MVPNLPMDNAVISSIAPTNGLERRAKESNLNPVSTLNLNYSGGAIQYPNNNMGTNNHSSTATNGNLGTATNFGMNLYVQPQQMPPQPQQQQPIAHQQVQPQQNAVQPNVNNFQNQMPAQQQVQPNILPNQGQVQPRAVQQTRTRSRSRSYERLIL